MKIKNCVICDKEFETSGAKKVCSEGCKKILYSNSKHAAEERYKAKKRLEKYQYDGPVPTGHDYGKISAARDSKKVKVEFPEWVKPTKDYNKRKKEFNKLVQQYLEG